MAQHGLPVDSEADESSQLTIAPPEGGADSSSEMLFSAPEAAHSLASDAMPPDDYLQSSEELLRSLAQEESQVQVDRGFLESLATPLGVGSMLMLLLSSAMFGYVIMNPSSLSFVAGLFDRSQSPAPQASIAAPTHSDGSFAPIPNSPPLDQQEFVDLGLDNLTTLKSRSSLSSTQVKPSPKATASPSASPAASTQPDSSVQPVVVSPPTPPQSAPAPARNSSSTYTPSYSAPPVRSYSPPPLRSDPPPVQSYEPPPLPAAPLPPVSVPRSYTPPVSEPAPAQGGDYSYKVEIPYTGDRSLEDARKVSPDAYLRPDGKIQLGATGNEADAKARAQELQNQGIPAEVNQR
ncbi:MAG: SPOR domain-containing protein [Leptolyngbyaceae cyanobacterium CSU_1_3]|nr:SPOR domain-containing protein [Leptolyngbyaceae cyanobacterium CSU_1_3]